MDFGFKRLYMDALRWKSSLYEWCDIPYGSLKIVNTQNLIRKHLI